MIKSMRQTTLQTLGLGNALEIFQKGQLPARASDLVDQIFGTSNNRGSMVISGANGIVGAGKTMQLGSRLQPFGVTIVALDFPNVADGIAKQYPGLVRAFGPQGANSIMAEVIKLNYDGTHLPSRVKEFHPRFLLEAIPEILSIKKAHYKIFKDAFPGIEIRSVTSGFPSSELGVGIAHPAFPHEINKIWEVVESQPSSVTHLFWALGLIPVPVSDHWSFVLDVLFCGLTLAALRFHQETNMPFWKIDKYVRKLLGANPLRAHDAIGAKGANFLTWSCLYHLSQKYGELFRPTPVLEEHKESGQNWYPPNHFRPLVNWSMDDSEEEEFKNWVLGPVIQMTSLMLHEKRAHLSHLNAIGELCAQFRKGVIAVIRDLGTDAAIKRVEAYHKLHPEAARECWYPDTFTRMDTPEWQQLYVNAEHDGKVGIVTISRESYNADVDAELNRAIDWLKSEKIDRVILTGDFHFSTQMIGADTSEFFPALENTEKGFQISSGWSKTARRLNDEFKVSVGFINGKRCLGGMLELLIHCHYLVSVDDAQLGMPEVTLPVVPGMEGCHWPFRKTGSGHWPKLLHLLLTGKPVRAGEASGWLIDFAGALEDALKKVWKIVTDADHGLPRRRIEEGSLRDIPKETGDLPESDNPAAEAARKAIMECIQNSCAVPLSQALVVQAKHSSEFMRSAHCKNGRIGSEFGRVMTV